VKNTFTTAFIGFLLLATTFTFFVPTAAASGTYTVSVGYADDLRPSPFFPTPWCSGVTIAAAGGDSAGCATSGAFDSGAILITNTGATSITITGLTVTTPNESGGACDAGCSIWSSYFPAILAPGQQAIFAQTYSYNFDTSDNGLPGVPDSPTNNCDTGPVSTSSICTTSVPTVSVTVDSTTSVFHDVGFVLITGGYDQVNSNPCLNPADTPGSCNESLQWRDISSTCGVTCPGGNPTVGAPEFGLPIMVVAAIGLLAIALVRKATLPRANLPARALRQST